MGHHHSDDGGSAAMQRQIDQTNNEKLQQTEEAWLKEVDMLRSQGGNSYNPQLTPPTKLGPGGTPPTPAPSPVAAAGAPPVAPPATASLGADPFSFLGGVS